MSERALASTHKQGPARATSPLRGVLQRKCACGNHTMAGGECEECQTKRLLHPVQGKYVVPDPNDASERAADQASAIAMAGNAVPPYLQTMAGAGTRGTGVAPGLAHRVERIEGAGMPLPRADRDYFEPRFGRDFSQVRVHTDGDTGRLAHDLNAEAFTFGRNIGFRPGAYAPNSPSGRILLAHELAHVAQRGMAPAGTGLIQRSVYDTIKEKAYAGLIAAARGAKNSSMTALRSRVPNLPAQYQSTAYSVIYVVEATIEILFAILLAVIGMLVGFGEGIVDMIKGLISLIGGATKLLVDLVLGVFTNFAEFKADVANLIAAITGLPDALKALVGGWIEKFKAASMERQSLMIGELTGQVLALIATYAVSVARAGTAARAAAGAGEIVEAGAETAAKVTSTGVKATSAAADVTGAGAKAAGTAADVTSTGAKAASAGAKATSAAAEAGEAGAAAKPALRVIQGGVRSSGKAATRGSAGATAARGSARAATAKGSAGATRVVPRALSDGGAAFKVAPEAEEAVAATAKQPALALAPPPEPVPLAPPEPVPIAPPEPMVAPSVPAPDVVSTPAAAATASGASKATKVMSGAAEAAAVATNAEPKPEEKEKKCNDTEPCDVLPILWPDELPPVPEGTRLRRTGRGEREAEGKDRGPAQRAFADCLKEAQDAGNDFHDRCGNLGGDWYDPDLLSAELVDAHHVHPLYLGGSDQEFNLAAIEQKRHRLGHKFLNNQQLMFKTDPTWELCRVCSPLLTKHPEGQEYEVHGGF